MQRVAYDTNVLVYLEGLARHLDDTAKIEMARLLHLDLAPRVVCVAAQQALGELYSVVAKVSGERETARTRVLSFIEEFETVIPNMATFIDAMELATEHKMQFWDSLILSTAASGGCSLLLSEDMQDGFAWRGVTVVNPFAAKMHKRLARVLAA